MTRPDARAAGTGTAYEQKRAAVADLPGGGLARDAEDQHRSLCERAARIVEVQVGERRVVRATGRHHHVVDRPREIFEEGVEGTRIVGVECRAAQRAELVCRMLQPFGIAAGQDDVGSVGSCKPRRLQADPGAAADHNDGLPLHQFAIGGPAPTGLRAATIFSRSGFSAAM
jgi:hypothetical protein